VLQDVGSFGELPRAIPDVVPLNLLGEGSAEELDFALHELLCVGEVKLFVHFFLVGYLFIAFHGLDF
jgi:hypothetical protein